MYKKIISNLLVVLLAAMLISARAETQADAETSVPYIELTSVPNLGETKDVQGSVYLGDIDPEDYVIIAIVGGSWPKPYFDSYQNKLTASGDEGYATFGFSVTTGGQDASYNTFTLYLCEAALFKGVSAASITDSYMQYRYIVKMEIDKTVFNAQTEQPQLTPAPSAESYVFQVYDDAPVHYGDIAYMGSKNNGNDGSVTIDPRYGENPHSGGKCMQITYTPPSSSHWAGMMWLSGANNFPPNLPVEGVDTTKASQLSFYARGYGSTKFFIEDETGQQVTLRVELTSDWTQYILAIPSDWANVCVGFGFASSGTSGDGAIYLDDIVFSNQAGLSTPNRTEIIRCMISWTRSVTGIPVYRAVGCC